jgi:hypothetical protein
MSLGYGEIFLLLIMAVLWLIPIVATVWAMRTLSSMRKATESISQRLEVIERQLTKPSEP